MVIRLNFSVSGLFGNTSVLYREVEVIHSVTSDAERGDRGVSVPGAGRVRGPGSPALFFVLQCYAYSQYNVQNHDIHISVRILPTAMH